MALTTKRIIALPSQTDPQEGDYLAIDNMQNGTHKIPVGRIGVEVDDTLTEQGKAADAKATGDALDEIRSQIEVTGTASGSIATFADGSDNPMKSCIVTIEPKQSGTGTPSPENVRQISGWESVSVFDTGVNVWDEEWENGTFNTTTGANINTGAAANQVRAKSLIPIVPNATYHFNVPQGIWCIFYDDNGNVVTPPNYDGNVISHDGKSLFLGDSARPASVTYTMPSSFRYMKFYCQNAYGNTYNNDISINYPSTDHGYHAYNGTTTPVNLGRTVYGGTLDVVSGVLTAYPFYPSYNGETLDGRWLCDRAVYAEGTTPPTGSQVALISGTGTTYTLTGREVSTLLGENNVWADSGDVEVVYIRDLNITINNLLSGSGTRSLGMMAMSAPTEATAEEPTDEPSEDDMR